jgi:predicted MFS family arabinose efflux permease
MDPVAEREAAHGAHPRYVAGDRRFGRAHLHLDRRARRHYLLDADKSLATAPVTGFNLGVALGALPAAALIRMVGQRNGFMTGTGMTALGGLIATMALFNSSFWLFAAGLMVIGFGGAFVQQFRFAAADNAPSEFKARAISFVLAGGVITAILGPQIVIFTRELLAPVMFAGSFASILVLAAVGAVILSFLRPRAVAAGGPAVSDVPPRPLGEIIRQPRFAIGLLCAVGSYALMSLVMTGAPLAMVGCGFTPDEATLGISWHVMAMFAPSFVTGRIIQRFGVENVVAFGLVLLIGCAVVALSGIALWQFWTALILLGSRLELRLHRRHRDGRQQLSALRKGQACSASTTSCCSAR